jgi:hypothetical protein
MDRDHESGVANRWEQQDMKLITLANRRWRVLSPSLFQLIHDDAPIYLYFNGEHWGATNGVVSHLLDHDRDTAAMMVHKELNAMEMADGA